MALLATTALALLPGAAAQDFTWGGGRNLVPATHPDISACISQPQFFSCENTTTIENTCCSPTPGGLVLLTQFWSIYTGREDKGQLLPKASWTIHGLWPDNCDGTYEQYCDFSRQYDPEPSPTVLPNGTEVPVWTGTSIDKWIKDFGRDDLLEYMNDYFVNQNSPNWILWAHEFGKHATCTSTFDVACYSDYREHEEIINYFDATVRADHQYPTYDILASVGIVPSNTTSYSLASIQSALTMQTGALPYIGCRGGRGSMQFSEVWYFAHVYGIEQYGAYKPVDTTTTSNCNETVWYYERAKGSEHEVRKDKWWW